MAVGGVYGADGTEYRTEQDTFRRIISYGQAGTGPNTFTVWTKSGLIFEYGGTEDSRIEAQGKTSALFWAVNRIADTKGNHLTVTYTEDSDNGEYRPGRIDYTANDEAGLAPYASVRFTYESRPDITPRYVDGTLLKVTQRLSAVRTCEGEQLYREYQLAYEQGTTTRRSRLASIIECGSDGSCFAPTGLAWTAEAVPNLGPAVQSTPSSANHSTTSNPISGDANGDGITDVIWTLQAGSGLRTYVALALGDGAYTDRIWSAPANVDHYLPGFNSGAAFHDSLSVLLKADLPDATTARFTVFNLGTTAA